MISDFVKKMALKRNTGIYPPIIAFHTLDKSQGFSRSHYFPVDQNNGIQAPPLQGGF
jgi:hypothetical protein